MSWDYDDSNGEFDVGRSVGHYQKHPLGNPKTAAKFLSQEKYWADASNNKRLIEDMDAEYILSTMIHLLKRAAAIKLSLHLYYIKNGGSEELLAKFNALSSEEFIEQTPLFIAMKVRWLAEPDIPNLFTIPVGGDDIDS